MIKYVRRTLIFLIIPLIFLIASSCNKGGKTYRIGVDPSWFPLEMMGKQPNVFAFSDEILKEISKLKRVRFERVNMSWDNLIEGLKDEKYDGMLSSIPPYNFNEAKYDFSDSYLNTGPVLLVKSTSKVSSMGHMAGREIAVSSQLDEALLIETYPNVIARYYSILPNALNDIENETIDGALVGYLVATSYVQERYSGRIKIASPPLTDDGLRLLTLKGGNQELIEIFNDGLDKLRDKGIYKKLLIKWDLN